MTLLRCLLLLVFFMAPYRHALGDGILLSTWGRPGSTQFFVHLDSAGLLTVERRDMLEKPQSMTLHPSNEQAQTLLHLATKAEDFSSGCDKVADGTSAEMKVEQSGTSTSYSCRNAIKWPDGPHIKAFINMLNALLPNQFHVY